MSGLERSATLATLLLLVSGSTWAQELTAGETALRRGDYAEALATLSTAVESRPRDVPARRALVRALSEVGRYEDAERTAREFASQNPKSVELSTAQGEALAILGRLDEAAAAFEAAIEAESSDLLVALANYAELRLSRGDHSAAERAARRLIESYNEGRARSSQDLTAVGRACRLLGSENPQLFKDALKAFDEAIAADPDDPEPRIRLGELFLEKYNGSEAVKTFDGILALNPSHPRALVGMARAMDFEGAPGAMKRVRESLEVNPQLAEARLFLAESQLARERPAAALREVESVLARNPVSLDALATLAAARYLQGDVVAFGEARDRALRENPRHAELFNVVADLCVRNRRYREAAEFARLAVELDDGSWRGYGLLGLNQLRLGEMEAGRRSLERAFAGDPYNVWIKNTLDLLDTFPRYEEATTERLLLLVHGKETALLTPYLVGLAHEALEQLSARYRHEPPSPVRIEVYPSHADFSVRTVGLAGLGALGACFGNVLAIDSPSAREVGQFNWGSTLWHELAHTITLGLTEHRVPRWLTEGISVHEERRARPGWGDDVSLEFLVALRDGQLLPIAKLNEGFIRPSFPSQVALSYYQASLVVELIEREQSFEAVLDLLEAYRRKATTDTAFRDVLGTSLEEFDRRFAEHLEDRFGAVLAALPKRNPATGTDRTRARPGDYLSQLQAGQALLEEQRFEEAQASFERALALIPELVDETSPHWPLAMLHKRKGDKRRAAELLTRLTERDETHYRAHVELAALREELGDAAGAAEILDRAVFIYPFEITLHERRAELLARLGHHSQAVGARRSIVALEPVDRAEALYRLARAHLEAGDPATARREVLNALEVAPAFADAQDLLLQLQAQLEQGARP